jgi:hypothetical protein
LQQSSDEARAQSSTGNVGLGATPTSAQRPGKSKQVNLHPTSTHHNSTNIAAMEAALALIESLDEGEHFTYTNVAKSYNVDRSTLSRRHRKVQAPKAEQAINQQLLSPH